MKYGYVRFYQRQNNGEFSLENQRTLLKEYGCQRIVVDYCEPTTIGYPVLECLIQNTIGQGDMLVVTNINRLARNLTDSLLDIVPYNDLNKYFQELPSYFREPVQHLREARDVLVTVEQNLAGAERRVQVNDEFQISQTVLDQYAGNFNNIINSLLHVALCIGGKNQKLPIAREVLEKIRERSHSLKELSELRSMQQELSALLQDYTEHYRSRLQEFFQNIYTYHPLIIMNNNFLRLDIYNDWRNKFKKYWEEVARKEPDMFRILDALAKSRRIYIKHKK